MINQQKKFAQLKIEDEKRRRIYSVKRDVGKKVEDFEKSKQQKE